MVLYALVLILNAYNLGVLGAAIQESLLQGPEVVKGTHVHHLHHPGQLHLANADQLIQIKPWCMSLWSNKIQDASQSPFSASGLKIYVI